MLSNYHIGVTNYTVATEYYLIILKLLLESLTCEHYLLINANIIYTVIVTAFAEVRPLTYTQT